MTYGHDTGLALMAPPRVEKVRRSDKARSVRWEPSPRTADQAPVVPVVYIMCASNPSPSRPHPPPPQAHKGRAGADTARASEVSAGTGRDGVAWYRHGSKKPGHPNFARSSLGYRQGVVTTTEAWAGEVRGQRRRLLWARAVLDVCLCGRATDGNASLFFLLPLVRHTDRYPPGGAPWLYLDRSAVRAGQAARVVVGRGGVRV